MQDHAPEFTQPQLPFDEIEYGYCHCGCGGKTTLSTATRRSKGSVKGKPNRFITGHNKRARKLLDPPNPSGLCMCGCGQPAPIAPQTSTHAGTVKGQPTKFVAGHSGRKTLALRFWEKVGMRAPNECWMWIGAKDTDGYGKLMDDGKHVRAHRVAWILTYGEIPDALHVLHNCPDGDRPSCCNPAHLWLGTNDDNIADKIAKKRQIRGEQVKNAKLTDTDIIEIRKLCATGTTKAAVSRMYGVTDVAITYIVNRRNWAHIP